MLVLSNRHDRLCFNFRSLHKGVPLGSVFGPVYSYINKLGLCQRLLSIFLLMTLLCRGACMLVEYLHILFVVVQYLLHELNLVLNSDKIKI